MASKICGQWVRVLTYSALLFVENVNTKIRFRFNYLLDDLNMFHSSVTEIVEEVGLPINHQQHAHHQQFWSKFRCGFHF